jgi:hypothetical protein
VGESFTTSENYFFLPALAAARTFGHAVGCRQWISRFAEQPPAPVPAGLRARRRGQPNKKGRRRPAFSVLLPISR